MAIEKQQYDSLSVKIENIKDKNEEKIGQVIGKIDEKLEKIRTDNSGKIEKMRETADEKLSSLKIGFSTLVIEKHSNGIWETLNSIQHELSKSGEVLKKTRKKLREASNFIESAETRTRVIENKLRSVGELERQEAVGQVEKP